MPRPAASQTSRSAAGSKASSPVAAAGTSQPAADEGPPQIPRGRGLTAEQRQKELAVIQRRVEPCTRCPELVANRTQTVFGVGNLTPKIVFCGEAPGADEDQQGEPFVGRSGQLLNKIIEACQMKREQIYILNVLKCRPPDNRTPLPPECANCKEYLDGQLELLDPQYIVAWGAVAAQNLLQNPLSIGKLRGRFHMRGAAKVLCTYHPSYLMRNPAAKKDVWEDMKFLFADMGIKLA